MHRESYIVVHPANGQWECKLCDNISKMFAAIRRRQALQDGPEFCVGPARGLVGYNRYIKTLQQQLLS